MKLILKPPIKMVSKELYIGGDSKGKSFANIMLSTFETYFKILDPPIPISYFLPEEMIQLIQDDMGDRLFFDSTVVS